MIFNFFKKKSPSLPPIASEPRMLTHFPVFLFVGNDEPFATWHGDETDVPASLVELYRAFAHGYIFYMWHLLVLDQFGRDVAVTVRADQLVTLNKAGDEFGIQTEELVSFVESAATAAIENPIEAPGFDEDVPTELVMALHLLTRLPESPFYMTPEDIEAGQIPDLQGQDFVLAECLGHAKENAMALFRPALAGLTIDARALTEWVKAKKIEFATM